MMHIKIFLKDILDSIRFYNYWYYYSNQDIKNKYTRSLLGPLWITLTIMITIFAMGPMYSLIFNFQLEGYLLHLTTGLVFWFYISGIITESASAFISNENFIKQTNFPYFVYILRIIYRNFLIFMHNAILIFILYLYNGMFSVDLIYIFPNLFLITILLFFISFPLACLSLRFRDLVPLVGSLMQLSMFLTPVFWMVSASFEKSKYLLFNPFHYLLRFLRAPIYSDLILLDYFILFIFILIFSLFSFFIYKRFSRKIVYLL